MSTFAHVSAELRLTKASLHLLPPNKNRIWEIMLLLDNIVFELQKIGGVSAVWAAVIEAVERDVQFYPNVRYLGSRKSKDNCFYPDCLDRQSLIKERVPLPLRRYMDIFCLGVRVFHSSYFRVHASPWVKNVVTVHDCTYELFGAGLSKRVHLLQKQHALRNAEAIICVSENTRKDLLEFYPWLERTKVRVIHNGVSRDFASTSTSTIATCPDSRLTNNRYILYVGGRGVHKNFQTALRLLASKPSTARGYSLAVVGSCLTESERSDASALGITHRIVECGNVENSKLRQLYSNALCLVYPSLYEGFGIPPLEAMAAGCPVLCSNAASLPEVVGEAAALFPPHQVHVAVAHLTELENERFREMLVVRGRKRASQFSWERTGEQTVALYKELLTPSIQPRDKVYDR